MTQPIWRLSAGLFALLACATQAHSAKAVLTPILSEPQKVFTTDPDTQATRSHTRLVEVTPRQPAAIQLDRASAQQLHYTVQGHYGSSGLSVVKFRGIRTEQQTAGTQLTVQHTVQLERIGGKESASIRGYNYQQAQMLEVPSHIQSIRIVLTQQYRAASATQRPAPTPTELELAWPLQQPLPAQP